MTDDDDENERTESETIQEKESKKELKPSRMKKIPMKIQYETLMPICCECLLLLYMCFCTHPNATTHTLQINIQATWFAHIYIYDVIRIEFEKLKGKEAKKSINVNNFSFTLFFRISHWVLFFQQEPEQEREREWRSWTRAWTRGNMYWWRSEYLIWEAHSIHAMSNCVYACVNKSRAVVVVVVEWWEDEKWEQENKNENLFSLHSTCIKFYWKSILYNTIRYRKTKDRKRTRNHRNFFYVLILCGRFSFHFSRVWFLVYGSTSGLYVHVEREKKNEWMSAAHKTRIRKSIYGLSSFPFCVYAIVVIHTRIVRTQCASNLMKNKANEKENKNGKLKMKQKRQPPAETTAEIFFSFYSLQTVFNGNSQACTCDVPCVCAVRSAVFMRRIQDIFLHIYADAE